MSNAKYKQGKGACYRERTHSIRDIRGGVRSAQDVTGGVAFTGKSGSQITLQRLDNTTQAGLGADFTFDA